MNGTARLEIPMLAAGQAQKELAHNEALQIIDILVAGAIEEGPRAAPPASPALGATFIVDVGPTGAWAGKSLNIAAFTSGGWRFVNPIEGTTVYVRSSSLWATFRSGGWELGALRGSNVIIGGQQVVGARSAAIAGPTGGSVVDAEARSVVGQILNALRLHGLIAP